jgi:hypothetical protein
MTDTPALLLARLLPIAAALAFGLATLLASFSSHTAPSRRGRRGWLWPAALSALFLGFSLATVLHEGPFGFWAEHTRNFWGNQIWFDLLLALGVAWFLLVPQAKALGMRPLPWLLLIICTGSVGMLAMVARWQWLRTRATPDCAAAAALGTTQGPVETLRPPAVFDAAPASWVCAQQRPGHLAVWPEPRPAGQQRAGKPPHFPIA